MDSNDYSKPGLEYTNHLARPQLCSFIRIKMLSLTPITEDVIRGH